MTTAESWHIRVTAGGWHYQDAVVEQRLAGYAPGAGRDFLKACELDAGGEVIDADVPCQLETDADGAAWALFLARGVTAAGSQRHFRLRRSERAHRQAPLVSLSADVMHQGQASYKITTGNARYFYHQRGAGFASLIDHEGKDWLSYRPYGGSDGKYRGIPNLAHPENHFHPGGRGCHSRILAAGPLKVSIASASDNGDWECRWEIFPNCARLTVLKVGHPYWFLYEGTPGGALDEAGDYCVTSAGKRRPLAESWQECLPAPKWLYFGTADAERVLFLAQHEAEAAIDSYWSMESNMTVFGFGREGLKKYLTRTPAQFTIGLVETRDFEALRNHIGAALEPLGGETLG